MIWNIATLLQIQSQYSNILCASHSLSRKLHWFIVFLRQGSSRVASFMKVGVWLDIQYSRIEHSMVNRTYILCLKGMSVNAELSGHCFCLLFLLECCRQAALDLPWAQCLCEALRAVPNMSGHMPGSFCSSLDGSDKNFALEQSTSPHRKHVNWRQLLESVRLLPSSSSFLLIAVVASWFKCPAQMRLEAGWGCRILLWSKLFR